MSPDISTRLLPLPLCLLALIAAGAAVWLLYRRDRALVSRAAGRLLALLRLVLATLLLLLLADPELRWMESVVEPGEVLLVVDSSASFSLGDPYRPLDQKLSEAASLKLLPEETVESAGERRAAALKELEAARRSDLVERALRGGWLEELASRFRVSSFALSQDLRPAALAAGKFPPAAGAGTDLGEPIADEVTRHSPETLSGVILFTDGNHHAASDPRKAARTLGLLAVPLIAVGVGALEAPPDLALAGVDATGRVFAGDEVQAQVTLKASGLGALDLPLAVAEAGNGTKSVKEFVAAIPAGEGLTRLPVSFPAGEPGRKKFTISFPPQPGEVAAANNTRDLWIEVLSQKARVLLLDSGPRWEWRYLRSGFERDRNIDLVALLVTPPPDRHLPPEFPRRREELFAFDAVLLGDVEPSLFAAEEQELLRDFVTARGGALVLLAGERALPYRWAGTPLEEVLPVELLRPAPSPGLGKEVARKGLPLTLTPEGQVSEITRLVAGRERNLELWELLPPPRWFSPVAGVRPGAEVLVTAAPAAMTRLPGYSERPPPAGDFLRQRGAVLLTHAFGAGRVLYTGIDSTWLWRFSFGDELHRRFWGQVVRWALAGKLSAEDESVRLGTDRLLYESPAAIKLEALILDAGGKPHESELVDAVITRLADASERRVRLQSVPRSGGRYRGALTLEETGALAAAAAPSFAPEPLIEYRVSLDVPDLPGYSALEKRAAVTFVVKPAPNPELLDFVCDRKLLEELAALSGGQFLPFHRFTEASRLLPDRSRPIERTRELRPWNHPLSVVLVLLGIVVLEWVLRKRWDLI